MPFALREITLSLFDKSRLVDCYREGRSCSVVVSEIIIFAKEIRLRQKGCLQVCSWEGLPYVCHSSGLQFCPNAFDTTVKRLLLWLITWLGWPWSSPDNSQTPHSCFVLCGSGHACTGDYLALISLQAAQKWFHPRIILWIIYEADLVVR